MLVHTQWVWMTKFHPSDIQCFLQYCDLISLNFAICNFLTSNISIYIVCRQRKYLKSLIKRVIIQVVSCSCHFYWPPHRRLLPRKMFLKVAPTQPKVIWFKYNIGKLSSGGLLGPSKHCIILSHMVNLKLRWLSKPSHHCTFSQVWVLMSGMKVWGNKGLSVSHLVEFLLPNFQRSKCK